jgi:hypothetical protein
MTKVVVRELAIPKPSKSVRRKTVIGEDGRKVRLRSLDADSDSFAGDLLATFKSNVSAARRKNRMLVEP